MFFLIFCHRTNKELRRLIATGPGDIPHISNIERDFKNYRSTSGLYSLSSSIADSYLETDSFAREFASERGCVERADDLYRGCDLESGAVSEYPSMMEGDLESGFASSITESTAEKMFDQEGIVENPESGFVSEYPENFVSSDENESLFSGFVSPIRPQSVLESNFDSCRFESRVDSSVEPVSESYAEELFNESRREDIDKAKMTKYTTEQMFWNSENVNERSNISNSEMKSGVGDIEYYPDITKSELEGDVVSEYPSVMTTDLESGFASSVTESTAEKMFWNSENVNEHSNISNSELASGVGGSEYYPDITKSELESGAVSEYPDMTQSKKESGTASSEFV